MPSRDLTPTLRARRALFALGLELPGRKLTWLVEQLLAGRARHPGDDPPQIIRRLLPLIEDGPVSLVADEPELRERRLDPPAGTVSEAAERVLLEIATQLFALPPGTLDQPALPQRPIPFPEAPPYRDWTPYAPMPEPQSGGARPPGGPGPPAPPGTWEPRRRPDPADPGPPIMVRLDDLLLGDLGNTRVDARLVGAILLRDGRMAAWLRDAGVDLERLEDRFPDSGWS